VFSRQNTARQETEAHDESTGSDGFGQNDFYPFNRAELQRDEPEIFKLLAKIWGPIPKG
jgi:hypothetical protein